MKGKFPLHSKVCTPIIFGWYFWCEDQVASVSTFQVFYIQFLTYAAIIVELKGPQNYQIFISNFFFGGGMGGGLYRMNFLMICGQFTLQVVLVSHQGEPSRCAIVTITTTVKSNLPIINPLCPKIYIQILQTDLHTFL